MLNTVECALSVSALHYSPDRNQQWEMVHFISNCQCGVTHTPHLTFTCITGPCNYSRLTRTCGGGVPASSPPSQAVRSTGDIYGLKSLPMNRNLYLRVISGLLVQILPGWSNSPTLSLAPHLVLVIRSLRGGSSSTSSPIQRRYATAITAWNQWCVRWRERADGGRQTEKVRYRTRLFHIKSQADRFLSNRA